MNEIAILLGRFVYLVKERIKLDLNNKQQLMIVGHFKWLNISTGLAFHFIVQFYLSDP